MVKRKKDDKVFREIRRIDGYSCTTYPRGIIMKNGGCEKWPIHYSCSECFLGERCDTLQFQHSHVSRAWHKKLQTSHKHISEKKGHKIRNNLEKYVHTLQIGPSQVVKIELSFKRQTYVLGKHQFIIREQNYASSILFSLSLSVSLSLLSNVTTTSGFSKYTSVKREGRYEGGGKLSGKRGS